MRTHEGLSGVMSNTNFVNAGDDVSSQTSCGGVNQNAIEENIKPNMSISLKKGKYLKKIKTKVNYTVKNYFVILIQLSLSAVFKILFNMFQYMLDTMLSGVHPNDMVPGNMFANV